MPAGAIRRTAPATTGFSAPCVAPARSSAPPRVPRGNDLRLPLQPRTLDRMTVRRGEVAIVIGGSIAGLLAARVLHPHFCRVVIVERDTLPVRLEHRRGVPQGRHPHVLHPAGYRAFERLVPGISAALREQGVVFGDALDEVRRHLGGGYFAQTTSGLTSVFTSRTVFEDTLRRRARALPNVEFMEGYAAAGLVRAPDGNRITGIRIHVDGDRSSGRELSADLVVDASGRGSRLPAWLQGVGLAAPASETLEIRLAYVTGLYVLRSQPADGAKAVVVAPTAAARRGGAMLAQEGRRWIVTVAGYMGETPPRDPKGFSDFAASLAAPDIHRLLRGAHAPGELVAGTFRSNLRRRYDSVASPPAGLVALGDSVCSFNPFAGQGMSVCAQQAEALADWLAGDSELLPERFYARCAPAIGRAWSIVVEGDRRLVGEPRRVARRALDWYTDRVAEAAHRDRRVALAYVRVMSLLDPSAALLLPGTLFRVSRAWLGAARTPGNGTPAPPAPRTSGVPDARLGADAQRT